MNYSLTGKIKVMKKLIFLILISFVLCSCPDNGSGIEFFYKIENKSPVVVELIPYYNGTINFENKILLGVDGEKVLHKISTDHLDGFTMPSFFLGASPFPGALTHIEIVFNNSKKTLYEACSETNPCSQPQNIFNPIYSDTPVETYTITQEDYQNATDCGGNCY